jgi:hypothetical protein
VSTDLGIGTEGVWQGVFVELHWREIPRSGDKYVNSSFLSVLPQAGLVPPAERA